MSEENTKEGVVIDVTPESEKDPHDPAAQSPEDKPRAPGNRLPLVIAVIALLSVVGVLVAAFQYTQRAAVDLASINDRLSQALQAQQSMQNELDQANAAMREQAEVIAAQRSQVQEQQQTLQQQKQTLAEARERFQRQEQLLDSERLKMQQREAELRASVADVHKRVGSSNTEWMVAEAEYLMRVANNRLALARDTDTARSALELADQRLRDTRDPGWNPVRDQLARDITALEGAPLPDVAGLSARLQALAEQVPKLQLANATLGGTERTPRGEVAATPRELRNWDTLLDDLWTGFKETVRIRRRDKPVSAMLAPEQQFFLYENLRLQLESARLAVARADRELYRDSLNTVGSWLTTYFDNSDPLTQSTRNAVNELIGVEVRPALPDISTSLRSLQVRRKLNADLAGSPPGVARESAAKGETSE